MGLRNFFKKRDITIFGSDTEGEITNIIIAFLVSLSLLLFPLPFYGFVAVFAWIFFLVVAIVRRYNRYAIAIIAVVTLFITSYQVAALPGYLEEQRLYSDLIEVTPQRGRDYQDSYDIHIDVTNDNVDKVYYNVARTMEFEREHFEEFDFENEDMLTITGGDVRGGYRLLLILELKEGERTPHKTFGLYYLNPQDD